MKSHFCYIGIKRKFFPAVPHSGLIKKESVGLIDLFQVTGSGKPP